MYSFIYSLIYLFMNGFLAEFVDLVVGKVDHLNLDIYRSGATQGGARELDSIHYLLKIIFRGKEIKGLFLILF